MKTINRIVFVITVMVLTSVVFSSCNEEEGSNINQQIAPTKVAPEYTMGIFYPDGGCDVSECDLKTMHCHYPGEGNCLPEVTIYGNSISLLTSLQMSIDNNISERFVMENMTELMSYFDSDLLDGVVNNTIDISYGLGDNSKVYFIFTDNESHRNISVCPFVSGVR